MYSWSPNLSQISVKNSFGKVVFQIFAEIEMTQNENRLFSCHFEIVTNISLNKFIRTGSRISWVIMDQKEGAQVINRDEKLIL